MARKFISYNGRIVSDNLTLKLLGQDVSSGPQCGDTPFTNTKSIEFDGTDDYIDCGDSNSLSFGNGTTDSPFSISAWIKFDTTGTAFNILDKYNGYPNGEYRFLKTTSDTILIRLISNNQELNRIGRTTSSVASYVGVWIHVVATYNGNSAYNGLKIYVNGVRSDDADNGKNTYTAMKNTLYPVKIGNLSDGKIDEVAIFNTELSSTDVTAIYNSGIPNDLCTLNPLSWWRMGDGDTFPTLTDNGSGGNDGTMTNMSLGSIVEDVPDLFSNKSFTFDGTDDIFESNSIYSELNGGTKLTLSVWIKPISGAPTLEYIISNPRDALANNSQFALVLYEGNSVSFNVQSRTSQYVSGRIGAITYGAWNHILVCVDLDRTIGTEGIIFINGVDETTTSAMGTLTSFYNATDVLHIGIDANGGFNRYNGYLDEVAIWSGQDLRDSTSVETIYNQGVPNNLNENGLTAPTTYYRMGEDVTFDGTNWTLVDNGSSGINATSQNMVLASRTNDVPLFNTKSISFDGIDDYISIANNTTIARTQNISYSLWVNLVDGTARQYLVGNWTSSNGGTGLAIETSNTLVFQLGDGTNDSYFNSRVANFTTYAPNNTWNHILATWDGTDAKIYINGVLRNTWTPTSLTISNWSTFWIGRRFANTSNLTNGKLDEVALYNSGINISDVWDGSGKPFDISSSNPISWWRMGDYDSYPTLIDRGSGNNNGTMTNMSSGSIVNDVP